MNYEPVLFIENMHSFALSHSMRLSYLRKVTIALKKEIQEGAAFKMSVVCHFQLIKFFESKTH